MQANDAHSKGGISRMLSIGFSLNSGGKVRDVDEAGPSARAGLAPGMTLVAVNGRKFTAKILDEAILAKTAPIKLLIENGEYYREIQVNWSGGPHYPHLERIPNTPDRLSQVLKGRAGQEEKKGNLDRLSEDLEKLHPKQHSGAEFNPHLSLKK